MAIELQTNLALEAQPTDPEHVVNIQWVEQFFTGKVKAPVRLVSTQDIPGTPGANHVFDVTATGHLEIDGIQVAGGDRVLLTEQNPASENGIYTVTNVGNGGGAQLTRAQDFQESDQIFTGVTVAVNAGDNHSNTTWKLVTDGPFTVGTTSLEFIKTTVATGTKKFAETITGDGTETDFEVEHELGSEDVSVSIFNESTKSMVLADVTIVDGDTVEIGFAEPPPASAGPYRITVIG